MYETKESKDNLSGEEYFFHGWKDTIFKYFNTHHSQPK